MYYGSWRAGRAPRLNLGLSRYCNWATCRYRQLYRCCREIYCTHNTTNCIDIAQAGKYTAHTHQLYRYCREIYCTHNTTNCIDVAGKYTAHTNVTVTGPRAIPAPKSPSLLEVLNVHQRFAHSGEKREGAKLRAYIGGGTLWYVLAALSLRHILPFWMEHIALLNGTLWWGVLVVSISWSCCVLVSM